MITSAKILVVDDDAGIRFFVEEALRRDGHQVTAVESGEAALDLFEAHEFDLALIDLKLGGIGGTKVLASLHQRWPDTVVIMLTAYASLESAIEALRHGAHDYLVKPSKVAQLRESVRTGLLKRQEALRRRALSAQLGEAERAQPAPSAGDAPAHFLQREGLLIDFVRHSITLAGRPLDLSPTEFDILVHLARQAPRVVSPQELAREVQKYESQPWEARDTVRYHIYRIRQKAEAAGRPDLIKTVRGIGYALGW